MRRTGWLPASHSSAQAGLLSPENDGDVSISLDRGSVQDVPDPAPLDGQRSMCTPHPRSSSHVSVRRLMVTYTALLAAANVLLAYVLVRYGQELPAPWALLL